MLAGPDEGVLRAARADGMVSAAVGATRGWWQGLGSRRVRITLIVLLVLAAILRFAWVAYAGHQPPLLSDPGAYLILGQRLAHGESYGSVAAIVIDSARVLSGHAATPIPAGAFYPPGYPALIAAILWVTQHSPLPDGDPVRAVGFVQAILGAATVGLVFLIARRVFDAGIALVAAAIVAFFPNLITVTATLQLETFFMVLAVGAVLLLLPIVTAERAGTLRLLLTGAFIGVVMLVRPTIAMLLLAVLVTFWAARRPWRSWVRAFGILTVAAIVLVVPWTIRNAVQMHAFVPVSTGIGLALCQSRNDYATGGLDINILSRSCTPAHSTDLTKDEVDTNTYATRRAAKWVVHNPADELRMWFWRTSGAYQTDSQALENIQSQMDPRWYQVVKSLSDGSLYILLTLAALGSVLVIARREVEGTFLLIATVSFAIVPILLFGDPRYKVPAEPLFADPRRRRAHHRDSCRARDADAEGRTRAGRRGGRRVGRGAGVASVSVPCASPPTWRHARTACPGAAARRGRPGARRPRLRPAARATRPTAPARSRPPPHPQ